MSLPKPKTKLLPTDRWVRLALKHAVPTAPAADRAARARLRALGVFRVNAAVPRVASHPSNRTETIRVPRDDEVITRIPGPCASRGVLSRGFVVDRVLVVVDVRGVGGSPGVELSLPSRALPGSPPVPLALGLAGAIPFVALAAPVSASIGLEGVFPEAYRAAAQAGYGAAILSFLGGTQWGFAASGYGAAAAHVAHVGSGKAAANLANLAKLASLEASQALRVSQVSITLVRNIGLKPEHSTHTHTRHTTQAVPLSFSNCAPWP